MNIEIMSHTFYVHGFDKPLHWTKSNFVKLEIGIFDV